MKKLFALFCGLVLAISAFANPAFDPTTRPIEIVVPYPPGGATDKWGRVISEIFTANGWKNVVINKPGADTVIGSNYVAQAKSDGHTIYIGGNGFLDANLAFKNKPVGIEYTENSFTEIVPLGAGTAVLAVNKDVPVNSYDEFKKYVKSNPDKFNLGFWNSYTANIFYEWARREGLPKPNIVLYKGSAPQVADILGGHIPFVFDTYTAMAPHYESGKVKILAVLDQRGVNIVKKPGIVSIGKRIPEVDVSIWYGLYAPAGTPRDVVARMNAVVNEALKNPKYTADIEMLHIANFGGSPEDQKQVQVKTLSIMRNVAKSIE